MPAKPATKFLNEDARSRQKRCAVPVPILRRAIDTVSDELERFFTSRFIRWRNGVSCSILKPLPGGSTASSAFCPTNSFHLRKKLILIDRPGEQILRKACRNAVSQRRRLLIYR